jgi:hypothetical protein
MKQKLTEKRKIDKFTAAAADLNAPLLVIDRIIGQTFS